MIRTALAAAALAAALLTTLTPGAFADESDAPVEVKAKRIRIVIKKDGEETTRDVVVDEGEESGVSVEADGGVIVLDGDGERIELGNLEALIRRLWMADAADAAGDTGDAKDEDDDIVVWEFDADDGKVRGRSRVRRRAHVLEPAVRRLLLREGPDGVLEALQGEVVPHLHGVPRGEGAPGRRPGHAPERMNDADANQVLRHIMAILHHHLHPGERADTPHRAPRRHGAPWVRRGEAPKRPMAPSAPKAPEAPKAPRRAKSGPQGALQQILQKLDRMEGRLEDLDRRLKALEGGADTVKVVPHESGDVRIHRFRAPDGSMDIEGLIELREKVEDMARKAREKAKDATDQR